MNNVNPLIASILTIHARIAAGKPVMIATAKPASRRKKNSR